MSNVAANANVSSQSSSPAQHMGAGSFFGAIHGAREQCGAIFSDDCRRLTLDELAREAGVHPVHLSRVFRRCVGEGIGEHVHRLRVRTACERLLSPHVSLSELGSGRASPIKAISRAPFEKSRA